MPRSADARSGADPVLARALRRSAGRLMPFLLLLYILAFLDRVNVGYAKQSFLRDTGLSEAAYAFGAGVFFVGYALFEVPSNLAMHRVGARVWMCRIMVTWGLVCAAMMLATTAPAFYTLRFLLGVAEAGFFPGVILYLTYWFPAHARGPMMGLFYLGAPLAQIFGGPLSGLLLEMEGVAGWHGWQWMFLVEGMLTVAVGVWTFWYLPNRPGDARWLPPEEKAALLAAVAADERERSGHGTDGLLAALRQPRLLGFGLAYCFIQVSVYGVTFYLPAQVAGLLNRETGLVVGLVSALPWTFALLAAYAVPRLAARLGASRGVACGALVMAAAGIAASASGHPAVALAAFCVAAGGFIGAQPVFWTFPVNMLSGAAAAGGIAFINSFGAVGGFLAPNVRIFADTFFGSSAGGPLALALAPLLAAGLLFGLASSARTPGTTAPGPELPRDSRP